MSLHEPLFPSVSDPLTVDWAVCLDHLRTVFTPQQYVTWIEPLRCTGFISQETPPILRLTAPNRFKQNWARENLVAPLAAWLAQQLATTVHIDVSVQADDTAPSDMATQVEASSEPVTTQISQPHQHQPGTAGGLDSPDPNLPRLNGAWTFDSFVPGKANQLARAAALQVADNPGSGYNPLFLYGGVGLGKSHLIHAIGNSLRQRLPQAKIRYIHAETYVSDVVKAYQRKSFDDFKRYYHSLDLLLIDDIQFFSGKSRTQEEFFYAFEALIAAKKQLIITSDTYPSELGGIDMRLVSRFGSGLTVAIEPPELEMRVAILLRKADAEGLALEEDVAFFVARQLRSNVRELEGALRKIVAYCHFHQATPSLDHVKEALRDLLSIQKTSVSVENIQKIVSDFYKIKVAEMYSKRRPASIALPRQIAMYLAKELTQKSLPEIGDLFGGRDHTTVLHAIRKIQQLRQQNNDINREIHILEQQIRT
ncbi:MAG: chromosomal replication initiator protein DnaA [Burkholderiaceae bacterium]|jgi:chromosomal replication initiator protein